MSVGRRGRGAGDLKTRRFTPFPLVSVTSAPEAPCRDQNRLSVPKQKPPVDQNRHYTPAPSLAVNCQPLHLSCSPTQTGLPL